MIRETIALLSGFVWGSSGVHGSLADKLDLEARGPELETSLKWGPLLMQDRSSANSGLCGLIARLAAMCQKRPF